MHHHFSAEQSLVTSWQRRLPWQMLEEFRSLVSCTGKQHPRGGWSTATELSSFHAAQFFIGGSPSYESEGVRKKTRAKQNIAPQASARSKLHSCPRPTRSEFRRSARFGCRSPYFWTYMFYVVLSDYEGKCKESEAQSTVYLDYKYVSSLLSDHHRTVFISILSDFYPFLTLFSSNNAAAAACSWECRSGQAVSALERPCWGLMSTVQRLTITRNLRVGKKRRGKTMAPIFLHSVRASMCVCVCGLCSQGIGWPEGAVKSQDWTLWSTIVFHALIKSCRCLAVATCMSCWCRPQTPTYFAKCWC